MEEKTRNIIAVGVFISIAAALLIPAILPGDKIYFCDASDSAGYCWKLSKENPEGISTRCYYNESATANFKTCSSGWYPFPARELNIDDYINQEDGSSIIHETDFYASPGIKSDLKPFEQLPSIPKKERCSQLNCNKIFN